MDYNFGREYVIKTIEGYLNHLEEVTYLLSTSGVELITILNNAREVLESPKDEDFKKMSNDPFYLVKLSLKEINKGLSVLKKLDNMVSRTFFIVDNLENTLVILGNAETGEDVRFYTSYVFGYVIHKRVDVILEKFKEFYSGVLEFNMENLYRKINTYCNRQTVKEFVEELIQLFQDLRLQSLLLINDGIYTSEEDGKVLKCMSINDIVNS